MFKIMQGQVALLQLVNCIQSVSLKNLPGEKKNPHFHLRNPFCKCVHCVSQEAKLKILGYIFGIISSRENNECEEVIDWNCFYKIILITEALKLHYSVCVGR